MAYGEFAKIYDELINEDINYELIEKRLKEIMDEHNIKYDDYLDLACGTGNVAVKIAKYFNTCYAVDLSEDMLTEAFDKFQEERVKARVICQDMTELDLNHKFDAISCVLDSTNYILEDEDLENYFKGVYNHLKDDGLFIFDINSYYKLANILGNNIFTYSEDRIFYSWENVFEDEIVNMYLTFFVKQGSLYERFEEEHYERAYTEEYLESVLKLCGFDIVSKFDGYSNNKVESQSERILYVVKKRFGGIINER